ncbi:MAG: Ig-like domain-containing protein, partial [Clostridia bacterium]|nr:Ig-like domain-containing protein [Clostridia bacterium]
AQPDNGYGSENYLEINSGGTWNDCPNDANGYDASLWARVRGYILRYEPVGITVSPRQAQYAAGHNFSTDDFKVLVTFEDGATVETTDYEINVSNSGSGERTAIIRYGDLSAQCNVLIGNVVEGIRFSVDSVTMAAGEQQSLEVIYEPANATLTALQWESSNEAVATISENGIVTAIASGKAIITARTVYGEAVAECAVTVITPVSFKVTIEKNMWSKINTETDFERILQSMKAILTYDDGSTATITDYQWKNDFSPMSILNGEEEKKVGTYIFTLTYGALEDRMVITFIEPVTGVSINKEQLTLKVEETETLVAQVYPANATVQSVLWASENENVATVSKSGEITAKGRGETKITVTTLDGSYKAECKVTVKADGMDSPDFILPKAMKRIEEEAFMGVGASVIQCPEGLTRIGVRAFANCPKLRQIYIPESCTYIDKSAFDGCSATLTIFGKGDSIAEMYARAYGINFEEVNP